MLQKFNDGSKIKTCIQREITKYFLYKWEFDRNYSFKDVKNDYFLS